MDREIVGVGRAIQKKKLWKSISKLSRVLRLLTTDTEKKNVVRVEQNLTKFVFVTSTFKIKRRISLKRYEKYERKGGLISLLGICLARYGMRHFVPCLQMGWDISISVWDFFFMIHFFFACLFFSSHFQENKSALITNSFLSFTIFYYKFNG